ncbi:hypothetical protein C4K88_10340 [Arthrobacter pityocampae]|uniref:Uncharacterized protein n=1 Tax=Arthrobacter pityocampae TaxID=547334 RepID=A0A2S5IWY8_9MICC|nr:hypothetical protein [Arthrobacter pityocampae]PPB49102.1 hypothetical protein C4K88_10340 [Arthrobacter pityocampae]
MSTPQDNPNGQNNGPAWDSPGSAGSGQGPYSQQPQSPSYAYPTQGAPGVVEKGPAPKEVDRAYYLILAAGIVYLLVSIISLLTTEVPDVAGAAVGVGIGLVISVIIAALYVLVAVFIRRGRNWARITATVLAALSVLGTLGTLLLVPMLAAAAESSGQAVPETSVISLVSSVLVTLLLVVGVVFTYLKPARPYFAPQRLGY